MSKPGEGAAPPRSNWAGGGRRGRQPKLRLLGSLRGDGVLVWSGGSTPVAYELDVFGGGATRSASGFLEGDLSDAGGDASAIKDTRLRLADGREVAIGITGLEPEQAEVEASLSVEVADFLIATA